jgi:hypothetical protein
MAFSLILLLSLVFILDVAFGSNNSTVINVWIHDFLGKIVYVVAPFSTILMFIGGWLLVMGWSLVIGYSKTEDQL